MLSHACCAGSLGFVMTGQVGRDLMAEDAATARFECVIHTHTHDLLITVRGLIDKCDMTALLYEALCAE